LLKTYVGKIVLAESGGSVCGEFAFIGSRLARIFLEITEFMKKIMVLIFFISS
jgi:hypothetical protein